MSWIRSRLKRAEQKIAPENVILVVEPRPGHEEEDIAAKVKEYEALHGTTDNLLVVARVPDTD